jgi:hypothetical protein
VAVNPEWLNLVSSFGVGAKVPPLGRKTESPGFERKKQDRKPVLLKNGFMVKLQLLALLEKVGFAG